MKTSWEKIKNNLSKLNLHKNFHSSRSNTSSIKDNQQFDRAKKPDKRLKNEEKNTHLKTTYIVLFIWGFTVCFYLVLFSGLSQLTHKVVNKIELNKESSFEVYKPGIDIISSLKGKKYLKYVQRLYVHPKEENKMMIMIKPNYWGVISKEEQNKIKSEILEKWEKLYNGSKENEDLKPETEFANG